MSFFSDEQNEIASSCHTLTSLFLVNKTFWCNYLQNIDIFGSSFEKLEQERKAKSFDKSLPITSANFQLSNKDCPEKEDHIFLILDWSNHTYVECCVRFGSQENPSSQPPLHVAPQSGAASAQLDCHSGVRLKCILQTFIHSCLELSVQLKLQDRTQGSRGPSFYTAVQGAGPVGSFSFAQLRWSGFITQKLDCARGKSQLFHTTWEKMSRKPDVRTEPCVLNHTGDIDCDWEYNKKATAHKVCSLLGAMSSDHYSVDRLACSVAQTEPWSDGNWTVPKMKVA